MFRQTMAATMAALMLTSAAHAGIASDKVAYRGGSVALKQGDEAKYSLIGDAFSVQGKTPVSIPYSAIQTIEYGQKAGRRIGAAVGLTILAGPLGLLALASKKRKHMVTLTWTETDGKTAAAVFEFGKDGIRPALAALEARSGKQIEYESEDARKNVGR